MIRLSGYYREELMVIIKTGDVDEYGMVDVQIMKAETEIGTCIGKKIETCVPVWAIEEMEEGIVSYWSKYTDSKGNKTNELIHIKIYYKGGVDTKIAKFLADFWGVDSIMINGEAFTCEALGLNRPATLETISEIAKSNDCSGEIDMVVDENEVIVKQKGCELRYRMHRFDEFFERISKWSHSINNLREVVFKMSDGSETKIKYGYRVVGSGVIEDFIGKDVNGLKRASKVIGGNVEHVNIVPRSDSYKLYIKNKNGNISTLVVNGCEIELVKQKVVENFNPANLYVKGVEERKNLYSESMSGYDLSELIGDFINDYHENRIVVTIENGDNTESFEICEEGMSNGSEEAMRLFGRIALIKDSQLSVESVKGTNIIHVWVDVIRTYVRGIDVEDNIGYMLGKGGEVVAEIKEKVNGKWHWKVASGLNRKRVDEIIKYKLYSDIKLYEDMGVPKLVFKLHERDE